MGKAWLGVPTLLVLAGCSNLDPARAYQEAARQLHFTLDRVEPSIQVGFPLETSRIGLRVTLGVDNPSGIRFRAQGLEGNITLDDGTKVNPVGRVSTSQPIDLPPGAHGQLPFDLSFSYGELRSSWTPMVSALRGRKGTWRMDGELRLSAFGVPFTLPVHATRAMGN